MMKIFKSTKPAVCGAAAVGRFRLKTSRHIVFIPLLIFMSMSGAVIFGADNKDIFY